MSTPPWVRRPLELLLLAGSSSGVELPEASSAPEYPGSTFPSPPEKKTSLCRRPAAAVRNWPPGRGSSPVAT